MMSLSRFLPLVLLEVVLIAPLQAGALPLATADGPSSSRRNYGDQVGAVLDRSLQQRPMGIVIMAQGRSGSTMLGETFRQNKVRCRELFIHFG